MQLMQRACKKKIGAPHIAYNKREATRVIYPLKSMCAKKPQAFMVILNDRLSFSIE